MTKWPDVTFGGDHEPYIDRIADEEPYITVPKTVVAYGLAEDYPWSVVFFQKHGDPEDDVDEGPEPTGRWCEFFLGGTRGMRGGEPGGLGGGASPAVVPHGRHINTTADSWETTPPLIGYVVLTSDDVVAIDVEIEGDTRRLDALDALEGFPKLCVFFPPFNVPGDIVARDASENELHRRRLYHSDRGLPLGAGFSGGD